MGAHGPKEMEVDTVGAATDQSGGALQLAHAHLHLVWPLRGDYARAVQEVFETGAAWYAIQVR